VSVKGLNTGSGNHGNFFAVDHRCWAKACAAGMNAASAYLVHARGTGRDQRITSWSVQALETYTGISRSRAQAAIKALQSAGVTNLVKGSTRPQYEILSWSSVVGRDDKLTTAQAGTLEKVTAGKQPEGKSLQSADSLVRQGILEIGGNSQLCLPESKWIWLPNEFVTGAAGEAPPLELLRQTQDVMGLRLAVDLYREQNLWRDNQGEDPATIKVRMRRWWAEGRRA